MSIMDRQPPEPISPGAGNEADPAPLLAQFLEQRDEAAFEALVRLHGPMVYGACLRILGNRHDAEDTFQATFLVLARKAATIEKPSMLANWLYRVAHHRAFKAKAAIARRRQREKQMPLLPEPKPKPQHQNSWSDLAPLLDQELGRLSARHRMAVLLCDVEGKTRRAAAQQLGWAEGTLATRLRRARSILAQRLSRRGVVLSTSVLAVLLAENAACAALPAALVTATVQSAVVAAVPVTGAGAGAAKAAALTKGVWKSLVLGKVALAATVGAVAAAAAVALSNAEKPAAEAQTLELPPEIQTALEENARQLLPISVSYNWEVRSRLPLEETLERLQMTKAARAETARAWGCAPETLELGNPDDEKSIFSPHACRLIWQDQRYYESFRYLSTKPGEEEAPKETELAFDGQAYQMGFRNGAAAADTLHRVRVHVWSLPPGLNDFDRARSYSYPARAAGVWHSTSVGEPAAAADSEVLRTLKGAKFAAKNGYPRDGQNVVPIGLVSVEEAQLDGRPHVKLTIDTLNWVRERAAQLDVEERRRSLAKGSFSVQFGDASPEQIRQMQELPLTRRMIYYLDPALHYALRRVEQWYAPDRLLCRTENSEFEQFGGRPLWLPRKCETQWYEFPKMPATIFPESLLTEVMEVSEWSAAPAADEQFVLNYNRPGTFVYDDTLKQGDDKRGQPVSYKVPERPEDLPAVIEEARQKQQTAAAAPAPRLEQPRPHRWRTFLIANGILLAGIALYFASRKMRAGTR